MLTFVSKRRKLEFISSELSDYAEAHSSPEPAHLAELNRETHLKILQPRMLSGHLQGRVLSMISHMIRPSLVLEIGTYTGYSAICLAEGLSEGGKLHTIEKNEELQPIAEAYFRKSGNHTAIHMHIGEALPIIRKMSGPFDLVFIDADKENYLPYYHAVFDKLPKGGFILADNVLWSGKVLQTKDVHEDPDAEALKAFNTFVQNDQRVENVLMPIRDGLMLLRKIED